MKNGLRATALIAAFTGLTSLPSPPLGAYYVQ